MGGQLKGRTALVTGGNRGIGAAIVRALADEGADVAFTFRENAGAARAFAERVTAEAGVVCVAERMDVTKRAGVHRVMTALSKRWARLDILVNNAGINKPEDFDRVQDGDWDAVLETNLKGPFVVTQEALGLLKKSTHASVVHIGSVSGQYGGPRTVHYAASKAGLISLGQVIARFTAPDGIRSNTVAAGLIESEMAVSASKSAAVRQAARNILLGRFGKKEEVAAVVVFLASDASSYITAQTINVNGGLYF